MTVYLALLVSISGILGLTYLNRCAEVRTSPALWLPTLWLLIVSSRPVSMWLAGGAPVDEQSLLLEGSPTDAAVYGLLLAAGLVVLAVRGARTFSVLKVSLPVLLYFTYCLVSVSWSAFPLIAFKRWTKDIGDLVMVLVVVTDRNPTMAIQRLFSRVGFIVLPLSVALIRYSDLGRGYDPDGNLMNTGVTTNKNTLGLVTFVLGLGVAWTVRSLIVDAQQPHRGRRLASQLVVLAFAIVDLRLAQSATSIACFGFGAALVGITAVRGISRRPAAVHALVATIVIAGGAMMLFGGQSLVTEALGRESNLTGRTEIWAAVIPLVPHPLVGAGFESFWMSRPVDALQRALPNWYHVEALYSSHNGYIETYANLGWIGVGLIALILVNGYRRACAAFRYDSALASISLALLITSALYSLTEAGFRTLTPTWITLLLGVSAGGAVATSAIGRTMPERPAAAEPVDARPLVTTGFPRPNPGFRPRVASSRPSK
jgi:exopolysaccharide production protein ExoQ